MEVLEGQSNLSPRSDVEEVYLADRPANFRLSCRTTVNGDVTVRTRPAEGVGRGSNSLVGAIKSLFGPESWPELSRSTATPAAVPAERHWPGSLSVVSPMRCTTSP